MNRFLIVNADDFGLTSSVSEGILKAHRRGIVSSTTVLVNRPLSKQLIRKAKSFKALGIGLHLNTTMGEPISKSKHIGTLVSKDGLFKRTSEYKQSRIDAAELEREWLKQINYFKKIWSREPTHLDSHHHMHAHPKCWKVFLSIAKRLKIPFRLPSNQFPPAIRREMRRKRVVLPQSVIGNLDPKQYWRAAKLNEVLNRLKPGIHEIVCHPGKVSRELQEISGFNKDREKELNCFTAHSVIELIKKKNIQLINFGYLKLR